MLEKKKDLAISIQTPLSGGGSETIIGITSSPNGELVNGIVHSPWKQEA
jgi:hypothetical protein